MRCGGRWPRLRRLWAGVGTITVGLVVTWLYSLLSEQALPHLRIASFLLHDYWPWLGAGLLALMTVSIIAERAHRQHEARAPRPLRSGRRSVGERLTTIFGRRAPVVTIAAGETPPMVGRATELTRLNDYSRRSKPGHGGFCLCRASRASARRPWFAPSSIRFRLTAQSESDTGSASSNTARVNPTCQCSKP